MSVFFAFINRLKYINRWGLMRNTREENVLEHSATVAMFAHALALLYNKLENGSVNPDRVGMIALYHETGEALTGDLPTPVKYFNDDITRAYKDIENRAVKKLSGSLPDEIADDVTRRLYGDEIETRLVKYADKLAAYVKCVEELAHGNAEFREAESSTKAILVAYGSPSVDYFIENFVNAYGLSLDRLSEQLNK